MDIIISIFLGYRNGLIAKRKGYNNLVWALYSIGTFFLGEIVGWVLMFSLFYRGGNNEQDIVAFIVSSPVRVVTALFCGAGGYLLIKYRLSKLPNKSSLE